MPKQKLVFNVPFNKYSTWNILSEADNQKALQVIGELVSNVAAPIKPYNPLKAQKKDTATQQTTSNDTTTKAKSKAKEKVKGKAGPQNAKQEKPALSEEQKAALKKEREKRKKRKEANKRRRANKRKAAARDRPSWLRKWIAAGTNEVTRALEHNKLACLFICKDDTKVTDELKDKSIIVNHLPSLAKTTGTPFCSIKLSQEQLFLLFGLRSLRAFGFYKTVDGEQKENAEKVSKVVAALCSLLEPHKSSTNQQNTGEKAKRKRESNNECNEEETDASKKQKISQ